MDSPMRPALEALFVMVVSDQYGRRVAHQMRGNGWQWPEGINVVHVTLEQARAAVEAAAKEAMGPGSCPAEYGSKREDCAAWPACACEPMANEAGNE